MNTNKNRRILVLGVLAGLAAAVFAPGVPGHGHAAPASEAPRGDKPFYQCSMHPSVVSDKPGDCPICGMRLQKVEPVTRSKAPAAEKRILYYRHPMRPDVTSKTPAKDEMGMDYTPVYAGEEGAESAVAGHAVVNLPAWRQELIGVATDTVQVRALHASIRTVGKIAYDAELYTAIVEYQEAAASRDKSKASAWPEVQERAEGLVRASASRLKLLGLSQEQIDKAAVEGAPTNLLYGSPGGTLWVHAEVYESDIGLVAQGQGIEVTLPALPGRVIRSTIRSIASVLDPLTRTVRVRAEIPNADGKLKPEMFVNVVIDVPLGNRLSVPADAVLDTGTRQLVYVEVAEGEFEPREIKAGRQAGGYYEVLSGLKAGESVVTRANFLIDSESRLRATGSKAKEMKK